MSYINAATYFSVYFIVIALKNPGRQMAGHRTTRHAAVILLAVGAMLSVSGFASAQQAFATPDEAVAAFASAVRAEDDKALLRLLGHGAGNLIWSGDSVQDRKALQMFAAAFDEKHQVRMEADGRAVLDVGTVDFPFPIPLVKAKKGWRWDTAAGRTEILYRRIGRNETQVIQTCLAFVDAQNEYAAKDRTGDGPGVYARRFVSSPAQHDGLYWESQPGEAESPLGKLFAEATAEGYRVGSGRVPFHGYYFKILTRQGPSVPGGALDYVAQGKMIGGFALVAYPAIYSASGVMTFVVNQAGVVFEKDLGSRSKDIAERMIAFNPDHTWKKSAIPEVRAEQPSR